MLAVLHPRTCSLRDHTASAVQRLVHPVFELTCLRAFAVTGNCSRECHSYTRHDQLQILRLGGSSFHACFYRVNSTSTDKQLFCIPDRGDTATAILLPKVVDAVRGKKSPLTGGPIQVVPRL